jgi:hypothetical protein
MDRGRVGEDRGSKETDGCPLTHCNALTISVTTRIVVVELILERDRTMSRGIVRR